MSNLNDSKELFDYWHRRVKLTNTAVLTSPEHIPTYELRHKCTNYDSLRTSNEVQILEEPERSQVIAVIKYECTAQALQRRAGNLREKAHQLEDAVNELAKERTRIALLIDKLKKKLFGKDKEVLKLKKHILALEAENEALRADNEQRDAYQELSKEFASLQKKYEKEVKRREELGRNNRSLGGRVSHAARNKKKLDTAREEIQILKKKIDTLENQNESLIRELSHLRTLAASEIIEVKPK